MEYRSDTLLKCCTGKFPAELPFSKFRTEIALSVALQMNVLQTSTSKKHMRHVLVPFLVLATSMVAVAQHRGANRLVPNIPEADHFTNVQMRNADITVRKLSIPGRQLCLGERFHPRLPAHLHRKKYDCRGWI